jgi:hypothetical protein
MLIDDMLVLDGIAIGLQRDTKGRIASLIPVDAATIARMLTDQGFTPPPPSVAYQQCYSADTEVMAERGWLLWPEVQESDRLATRNPITKAFEWQRPSALQVNDYDGELINFTHRSLDIAVTPDHGMITNRMPYAVGKRQRLRLTDYRITAQQLESVRGTHVGLPVTSQWNGKEVEAKRFPSESSDLHLERLRMDAKCREMRESGFTAREVAHYTGLGIASVYRSLSLYRYRARQREPKECRVVRMTGDQYCAFMGAYLAEGSTCGKSVLIAQREYSSRFAEFQLMLDEINGGPTLHAGSQWFFNSVPLVKHLKRFGHARDKFIPDEIMNATPKQLRIFWHYFWLGDGDKERSRVFTSSKRMADQLQEIAQKLGKWATIRKREPRDHFIEGRLIKSENCVPSYTVAIHEHCGNYTYGFKSRRLKYVGKVYCASVPNGSLYVRRNGNPVWCGNCLYGLPAKDLTTDDLFYVMRNERTFRRYGYSPVEQCLTMIAIGLNKQRFDLAFWTEGNIPEAMCFLPPDLPMDKVSEIQGWYDSILSGNLGKRRRLTFLPGYGSARDSAFRPNIIFPKEVALKTPWDEWQFQAICYAFGTSPSSMLRQVNRATAQQSAESAEEEGLMPKRRTIVNIIDKIVQDYFGFDDIETDYKQSREVDAVKQMTVDTGYAKCGIVTIDEIRIDLGKDPLGLPETQEPGVLTQNGFIPLTAGIISPGGGGAPQGQQPPNAPGGTGKTPPNGSNGKKPLAGKPAQGALPAPPKQEWSGSQSGPAGALVASKAVEFLSPEVEESLTELEREVLGKRLSIQLSPSYTTPQLLSAQVKIEHILRKVFLRQKDRAALAATELKKKYLSKRAY